MLLICCKIIKWIKLNAMDKVTYFPLNFPLYTSCYLICHISLKGKHIIGIEWKIDMSVCPKTFTHHAIYLNYKEVRPSSGKLEPFKNNFDKYQSQ